MKAVGEQHVQTDSHSRGSLVDALKEQPLAVSAQTRGVYRARGCMDDVPPPAGRLRH